MWCVWLNLHSETSVVVICWWDSGSDNSLCSFVCVFKVRLCLGQCFSTPHILCFEEASFFVLKCLAASWSGAHIAGLVNGWFVLTPAPLFQLVFCTYSRLLCISSCSPAFISNWLSDHTLSSQSLSVIWVDTFYIDRKPIVRIQVCYIFFFFSICFDIET